MPPAAASAAAAAAPFPERQLSFDFRRITFLYNPSLDAFERLAYPVHQPLDWYLAASGFTTDAKAAAALDRFGPNRFDVPLPPFLGLLREQMLAPFFVFQVFCVALWCLDDYWYYSLFTLFMLITFECTVVHQRLRNLADLRGLQAPKQPTHAYRGGR